MLRLFKWLIPVCCVLALAACGGGGGGGGPVPEENPPETLSMSRVMGGAAPEAKVAEDLANVGAGTRKSIEAGIPVGDYTLENGSLAIRHNGSGERIIFETGQDGVVDLYDNGYLGGMQALSPASKDIASVVGDGPKPGHGSITEDGVEYDFDIDYPSGILVLNDKAVELSFSTFGFWAVNYAMTGTADDVPFDPVDGILMFEPIAAGGSANLKAPDVAAEPSFTGAAVGMTGEETKIGSPERNEFIFGDAELKVHSGGTADLNLIFPGYYDIMYEKLKIADHALYNDNASTVRVLENNSPTPTQDRALAGFEMETWNPGVMFGGDNYVDGQFYGEGANPASEAVGSFGVMDNNGSGIEGSFGVKQ